jgi:hypothetical protein
MKRLLCAALFFCVSTMSFADTLTTCVADHTNGKDRKDLARWVFFAMAAHPDIAKYASPQTTTDLDSVQQTMGALVMRLLTVDCATEARQSFVNGGASAIQTAFETLGKLAMQEVMSNANVMTTMSGFTKYIDEKKLGEALGK